MKKKFEEPKNAFLSSLPGTMKNNFCRFEFLKWKKTYLPVVYLSQYEVEPGPVCEKWMKIYDTVRFPFLPILPVLTFAF